MALYNQWLYEFSLKNNNKSSFYHMSLCRKTGISSFFSGDGGSLWVPGLTERSWSPPFDVSSQFPASELPGLAGAYSLTSYPSAVDSPKTCFTRGKHRSQDLPCHTVLFAGITAVSERNVTIPPTIFLALARRNEETGKAL